MAPRSLWNGSIVFGLVTVPVKVYTATESRTVHFREVHAKDGGRIEHRRICPKEGKAVEGDEIVLGYQVSARKWVELTDEEVAAAAGTQTRLIDVDHFVPASEIDPSRRPTTSAPRTRGATLTRCCTPRSRRPTAPGSAAGSSTTASGR